MIFKAFGLRFVSEIDFPELLLGEDWRTQADVEVILAELEQEWNTMTPRSSHFAIRDGEVFFHIPGVGIYSIQEGKQIRVCPEAGADERRVRLYILGTCMGALLLQRRIIPLHGSAVVIDGKGYALVGDSGAGKSTLAAAFLNQGYRLLTDDVVAISIDNLTGTPMIIPSYPQQKLWQESIERLDMKLHDFSPLFHEVTKFAVPVASRFCEDSIPLAGVLQLLPSDLEHTELAPVPMLERFRLLTLNTYRHILIPFMELTEWHFSTISRIVSQTGIYRLIRPQSGGFTVDRLVSLILNQVKKGA